MQRQPLFTSGTLAAVIIVLSITLIGWAAYASAQTIPNPGDATSPAPRTPGHALISGPHEVVNPANGSLTLTFNLPVPPGRGLTPAFTISYSSAGAHVFGSYGNDLASMYAQSYLLSSDGWSYGAPVLTYATSDQESPDGAETCTVSTNYEVQMPDGTRRPLLLSNTGRSGRGPGYDDPCDGFNQFSERTSASLAGWLAYTVPLQDQLWGFREVTLTSPDGTKTFFPNGGMAESGILATDTVDRNGNEIDYSITSGNALTITDTLGRTITTSGFAQAQDTISIPGMSDAYAVAWASAPASKTISVTGANPGPCPNTTATMHGGAAVTSIATPEGTYTFTYDPVYGVVNDIKYPNGGEIRYAWGLNPQSEPAQLQTWDGSQYQRCNARFDNPVITERNVYVNGSEVEQQHFQYSTTWYSGSDENFWTNKQTVVTDTDEVAGTTRTITYNYVKVNDPQQPHSGAIIASETPVEQSVTTVSNGATLQTVTEGWTGYPFLPTLRQTARNGEVKESDYAYSETGDATMQLTQENDYDWGSGARGPLLRQINVNYASFSGSNIVDRPSSVITYSDAGQTRAAETDYAYDQTTPAGTSGVVQHTTPPEPSRGNLTTISRWLNTGSPAVTTLGYDDTGQILSETDPNGNATAYSYADSFSGGGAPAPTNAYVTAITPPTTPGCP
ncbi:MAG: hypothetical protein ACRDTS_18205, partial [Mycobacterium sp.]